MKIDQDALQKVRETRLCLSQLDTWLIEMVEPYIGQRILDVGCGMGNLISHFLDREKVIGVDISSESIEYIQKIFRQHNNVLAFNFNVVSSEFLKLSEYRLDTVISFNVLEHVEEDTFALKQIYDILDSRGKLVLVLPAHPILYGTMDQSIGHYRRYTKSELNTKLVQAHFQPQIIKYVNLFGALGWLFNGRILHHKVPPTNQLKLFNYLTPLVTAFESKLKVPFGLSLLAISSKL